MDSKEDNTYKFNKKEEEILKKLQKVEISVANSIKKSNRDLLQTRYYEQFKVNSRQGEITLENVFITVEQEDNGKISYHFRWLDKESELIEEKILVEDDGMLYTIPELENLFVDIEINMEELINENDKEEYSRGISERSTPETVKKLLNQKDDKDNSDEEKDEDAQKIEADLAEQDKDIKIGKHRKIKDDKIAEIMPEVFEEGKEYEIAEDNKSNKCIIVVKENGKYKENQKIEQGVTTTKKIFTIEPDGKQKESEMPDQLMRVPSDQDKEIAVTRDPYGDLQIRTVHVTPCQCRIARSVQMENEGPNKQEDKEITDTFAQEGGAILADEIAHKKEILEREYKVTDTNIEELKELDIEALMEQEADRVKMSKEGFKGYVKNANGKTLSEKIHNAQEEIVQEYMGNRRPR